MIRRVRAAYRRTGADLPWGDPRPTHGAEMEGWFWRFTDRRRGRVVVALCGVNQHESGDWAIVGVAAHPARVVRSCLVDTGWASADRFDVRVGEVFQAGERTLDVDADGARLTATLDEVVPWPHRLGATGIATVLPGLGHHWHPHVLGGRASGALTVDGRTWSLDGADVYAERNWGDGFPSRWWWGQAQGFADPSLCVAFGGGRLAIGPVGVDATVLVVRAGAQVLRFTPPTALVRTSIDAGRWRVEARRPGWRVVVDGDAGDEVPAVLPVPLPSERRNAYRDLEHLAVRLRVQVWRRGRRVVDDVSDLAALEVGATGRERFATLAAEQGVDVAGAVADQQAADATPHRGRAGHRQRAASRRASRSASTASMRRSASAVTGPTSPTSPTGRTTST